jgi:hypothetical protein
MTEMQRLADLVRERNRIDAQIASVIGRPMTAGHLGEWIAARVFDIELEASATTAGYDGRFTQGPLRGRTVNVKWYLKRDGLLDMASTTAPDHYLVLAGPRAAAASSRGALRPWCIASVHLFDSARLAEQQRDRGVGVGTASSVRAAAWDAGEVFPRSINPSLVITAERTAVLALFGPDTEILNEERAGQ